MKIESNITHYCPACSAVVGVRACVGAGPRAELLGRVARGGTADVARPRSVGRLRGAVLARVGEVGGAPLGAGAVVACLDDGGQSWCTGDT